MSLVCLFGHKQCSECFIRTCWWELPLPEADQYLVQAIDLDEAEWQAFAEGIAGVAMQREKRPDDFQKFKVALDLLLA